MSLLSIIMLRQAPLPTGIKQHAASSLQERGAVMKNICPFLEVKFHLATLEGALIL